MSLNMAFHNGSLGKESAGSVEDTGSIPGSGRSPGEGSGNPLQYSTWKILRTEDPGGLQSMGLQRTGHDRATNTFTFSILERTFLTSVHNRHYSDIQVKSCLSVTETPLWFIF